MSTPRIFHRTASHTELAALVDGLGRGLNFVYYEAPENVDLIAYRTPEEDWHTGRAFGEILQVQWIWNGAAFDVLLLTESEMSAPEGWSEWEPTCGDARRTVTMQTQRIRLFGTERKELASNHRLKQGSDGPAEWIETRVPRTLVYPVQRAPKHVCVRSIVYCFDGIPILTRWQRLEGSDE